MRDGGLKRTRPTRAASQVDIGDNRCAWIRLKGEDVKSGKGRSIPLHDFELARWLKAAITAGTLTTHNAFYLSFKAACAKLGLSPKLNVHCNPPA
jgi:hypothetical protein